MIRIVKPGAIPPLRAHQSEALEWWGDRLFGGLFMEPGTGKTKVSLELMAKFWQEQIIDTALIFAPNGVHTQWLEEQAPEHCPIPYRPLIWTSNRTKLWKEDAKFALRKKDALLMVAVNYEALTTKDGKNFVRWLLKNRKTGLFADESSRVRNPNAIRTRFAIQEASEAKVRAILTGTPIVKGFENLWSQFQVLSPEILKCNTFVGFRSSYCKTHSLPGVRGAVIIGGYQRIDELMKKIEPHIFVKLKKECIDIPDKIRVRSPVEMTGEQEKAYQTMRNELIVHLSELEKITVAHLISARAKLRQIAIGFIIAPLPDRTVTEFSMSRYERCLEHLDEAPGKVILWSSFRHCLAKWEEILTKRNMGYVRYKKGDNASIRKWKTDDKIPIFLGNPHSGGIGLNLAEAETMIYFNNIDDAEIRWQSEDRAHRMGQEKHLVIIDMYAPRTVEIKIQKQQALKESLADVVMKGNWRDLL